ncbi:ABC transporter permease [Oscillatoria sp. FACHB-1406]|uniref:ABC transporter permease n=1 Tax=Oscillatoria sp. FACHB-1406 TaxID=2692846 RepID=UPI001685D795|nr:ABC transporter permease [Oscillatoria sp. FACHB-1406]MBD2577728.1 ABC transporter permease [Oscillatoria sp. FACHB-1406]
MSLTLLEYIGESNPQFYREIKGKLTRRNVLVTVLISLLFQALLILKNSSDRSGIWSVEWVSLYRSLNWVLPIFAIAIGVYLLSSDLCREQLRGTLNFVRLSPQPSESILLGKLLGVPILLYLGIALILPLHFLAAASLIAGLPAGRAFFALFGVYPVWVGLSGIYYIVAMLFALLGSEGNLKDIKLLPAASSLLALITASMATAVLLRPDWMFYPAFESTGWNWFFLPERFAYPWLLGTLFALNLWSWQIANRSFRHPNPTLISKAQSYWIVGGTHFWLLGFALPDVLVNNAGGRIESFFSLLALIAIVPMTLLVMAAALSPSRKTLIDWARYRHVREPEKRELWRDLFLEEKSPALGAIAVHILLMAAIWLPWCVFFLHSPAVENASSPNQQPLTPLHLALTFFITAIVFSIYATLIQSIIFQSRNPMQNASKLLLAISLGLTPLPLITLFGLGIEGSAVLWLFSPLPFIGAFFTPTPLLLAISLAQLALLYFLLRRFQSQLQEAGESEFKRILQQG